MLLNDIYYGNYANDKFMSLIKPKKRRTNGVVQNNRNDQVHFENTHDFIWFENNLVKSGLIGKENQVRIFQGATRWPQSWRGRKEKRSASAFVTFSTQGTANILITLGWENIFKSEYGKIFATPWRKNINSKYATSTIEKWLTVTFDYRSSYKYLNIFLDPNS